MFENSPRINDDNNLVPENTVVIVPKIGITKESISNVIESLKGEKKRDFFVEASYFCLPMMIANQYGFIIKSTSNLTIKWDGKKPLTFIEEDELPGGLHVSNSPQSNVINFRLPFMLRTPPLVNLIVLAPPNFMLPTGITVLNGVVETDNLQFDFTLNLMINEPMTVEIPKGTPITALIPIPRGFADSFELKHADELYDNKVINFEKLSHGQWEHIRDTVDKQHYAETGQRGRRYFKGIDAWNNPFRFFHQK
jgi:hypothetical protein